jgi:serine phosphatase RsbU (regulator of sigma subunit)
VQRIIPFILASLFGSFIHSQGRNIDSIHWALRNTNDPLEGYSLHLKAAEYFTAPENIDESITHLSMAKRIAKAMKNDSLLGHVFYKIGEVYYHNEMAPAAIDNYNKGLLVPGAADDDKLTMHNHLGILYFYFGEFDKSAREYRSAIEVDKRLQLQTGESNPFLFNNLALAHMNLYQFDSAWYYHQLSLKSRLESGNPYLVGQSYNNIGSLFYEMEEYDSSLIYFEKGLVQRLDSATYRESAVCESKINIGKALVALKKYSKAESALLSAQAWAIEFSNPKLELEALEQMMRLYGETGRYHKAYDIAINFYELKDNLYGIEEREEVIRLNHEHMYNQKLQHDSLMTSEKERAQRLQEQKDQEIQDHKDLVNTIIEISLAVALVLVLGIVLLGYRSYKAKQKSAAEILFQKNEAEKQRDLASEQRDLVQHQKEQLEIINEEITDSITYAKRIQKAILPDDNHINRVLSKSFIFYRPKAIVAGDFYWVQEADNLIYFAAADCTGHGVPGAMVSVICANALSRAVDEFELRDPGQILDKTMDLLLEQLQSDTENVKDGMDICLCCLDRANHNLMYAGANNPLYLAQDGKSEMTEIKATKQGIGWNDDRIKFESHSIDVRKGDTIYSFTDGFPDQFGGPNGKKFKYKAFKQLLFNIQEKSLKEQHARISEVFDEWRGDLEQLDDVCVVVVRV